MGWGGGGGGGREIDGDRERQAWADLAGVKSKRVKETRDTPAVYGCIIPTNGDRIERRKSRYFYSLLTRIPRTVSNTYVLVTRTQPCPYHVQHIERLSRATCVPRGTKGQLSDYV